ncbi:ABC transporter membrane-spanning protein [Xylanibacillus composti]|uniref:ABC transporter membrane-spanning protein n=1 Tax=Xylanibacillus composti TaxID=1572762 RepID=A0A8J4H0W7_9BACL|nr:ABC transporter permease [Xylanibacillus composti]GIQ68849.1 ABC transporter membrane-spanning protein [Xylanibacillus composti]
MASQWYARTGRLVRFILRRDRLRIPLWLLAIASLTLVVAQAFAGLYPTASERQTMAETMLNPAMTAMLGKGYGLDNYTLGAMMAHQMLLMTAVAVGIMSMLLVARHTRADEEEGRMELIRSLPVGRLSNLQATVLVGFGTNAILALLVAVGLYSLRLESMDLEGSLLYGAALGAAGMFFTGAAAVFAQLSPSARGTIGLSIAVLLLAYLVRAIGDVTDGVLTWFSPLGWVLSAEVYVNNYWWPVILTAAVALLLAAAAYGLHAMRDLEAGIWPARPGRTRASVFLQSPLGLGLRLQRTGLIAWAIGMFVLGASYGSVLGDLDSFFADNAIMNELLSQAEGYSLTEQFIPFLMIIISIICTVPGLMAILKLGAEEKKNRTEHLLSRTVSRLRIMGSYVGISLATGWIMLSMAAIGLGLAASAVMEEPIALGAFYQAAMSYLPAVWTMIGVAVLLIGVAPKFAGLAWAYLGFSFFVVYLGSLLQFPVWLGNLSPFAHASQLPVEEMDYTQAFLLLLVAGLLIAAGMLGYRKRDIHG